MDAVSYPNVKVIEFIESSVIPLQLQSDALPYARDYNVRWTPNLLMLDSDGREHHRIIGFLPPVELLSSLLLGVGKTRFDRKQFDEAVAAFDKVISEYGYTNSAPEAVYFRGVTLYRGTHEPHYLKEAYMKLETDYHYSEWALRAYPYWLLP